MADKTLYQKSPGSLMYRADKGSFLTKSIQRVINSGQSSIKVESKELSYAKQLSNNVTCASPEPSIGMLFFSKVFLCLLSWYRCGIQSPLTNSALLLKSLEIEYCNRNTTIPSIKGWVTKKLLQTIAIAREAATMIDAESRISFWILSSVNGLTKTLSSKSIKNRYWYEMYMSRELI